MFGHLEIIVYNIPTFEVVATFIYVVIGYAGYLMFGQNVSDEVSPMPLILGTSQDVDNTLD